MKRAALVVTILFALVAFVVGFAGATAALDITRPVASGSTATVQFVVKDGDNTTDVADNLQKAGLIHNALVFRLFARFKHLDSGLKHGTYTISPGMTMDQIIAALEGPPVDESIAVLVPPGLRVTQYATYLSKLPNFNADNFLKIAQTGILLDDAKTPLWTKYWFIQKPGKNVKYALEGYLFPDTYAFNKNDDETKAIETMLDNLGEHLCPGPDNNLSGPNEYFLKKDQCLAHAATVDSKNTSIFSAMEKAYATSDDVAALQMTLTFASLTVRETDAVKYPKDAIGVTNVNYTRYMAVLNKTANVGGVFNLGSDPTVLYALDSASTPKDSIWWNRKLLVGNLADLAKTDPYNTYVVSGPPPGPIAAPLWADIEDAANPSISKYFYFVQDCHGTTLYATTLDQHNANIDKANACK
jgi:peptidoglycan lytic transglycosylase G